MLLGEAPPARIRASDHRTELPVELINQSLTADIYTLTDSHAISHRTARKALLASARHRGISVQPLSAAVGGLAELRRRTYDAYRAGLGSPGLRLPTDLEFLVSAVAAFADPLGEDAGETTWQPDGRRWSRLA